MGGLWRQLYIPQSVFEIPKIEKVIRIQKKGYNFYPIY